MPKIFPATCIAVLAAAIAGAHASLPACAADAAYDLTAYEFHSATKKLPIAAPYSGNSSGAVQYDAAGQHRLMLVLNADDSGDKNKGALIDVALDDDYQPTAVVRRYEMRGFADLEAVTLVGDGKIAVAEEGNWRITVLALKTLAALKPNASGMCVVEREKHGAYSLRITDAAPNDSARITYDNNDGVEALAYDGPPGAPPGKGAFFAADELDVTGGGRSVRIWRVPIPARATKNIDAPSAPLAIDGLKTSLVGDISDLVVHRGSDGTARLIILSHNSSIVIRAKLTSDSGGAVEKEQLFPASGKLPFKQAEGLAFTDDGSRMFIVGEPRDFAAYRLKVARRTAR